jgi:peptide/nickel transport system permease protein
MAGSIPASPTAEAAVSTGPAAPRRKARGPWAEAWHRFKRHRLAYWSLFVLGALVLAVLFGPLVYKVGINDIDFQARLAGPSAQASARHRRPRPRRPGARAVRRPHLAGGRHGGDADGRHGRCPHRLARGHRARLARRSADVGDRPVPQPAAAAAAAAADLPVPRAAEADVRARGRHLHPHRAGDRRLPLDAGGRLVRAQFFSLREKEFVEAARALGASTTRQVLRHILPNSLGR